MIEFKDAMDVLKFVVDARCITCGTQLTVAGINSWGTMPTSDQVNMTQRITVHVRPCQFCLDQREDYAYETGMKDGKMEAVKNGGQN